MTTYQNIFSTVPKPFQKKMSSPYSPQERDSAVVYPAGRPRERSKIVKPSVNPAHGPKYPPSMLVIFSYPCDNKPTSEILTVIDSFWDPGQKSYYYKLSSTEAKTDGAPFLAYEDYLYKPKHQLGDVVTARVTIGRRSFEQHAVIKDVTVVDGLVQYAVQHNGMRLRIFEDALE